jgi:hypothetical protein
MGCLYYFVQGRALVGVLAPLPQDWDYSWYSFLFLLSRCSCFPIARLCHVVALLSICIHCRLINIRWSDVQVVLGRYTGRLD